MKRTLLTVIAGLVASVSLSYAYTKKDIVDTAASLDDFSTLVAAVKAAGLVDTLKGDGPFTVFAPTNDAFAKLPEGTVENLLKPENKDQLVSILTYHVVPGKVMSSMVAPGDVKTVNGQKAAITVADGKVMIDNATVVKVDVEAGNGVIHVIDNVILPKEQPGDIVDIAAGLEDFSTLVAAVKAAGLVETLKSEGPFTVFAPTNDAFAKLPEGTVETLLKPENKDQLVDILTYHVVGAKVMSGDVSAGNVQMVNGDEATIAVADGKVMIDNATVIKVDVKASNGVIHVIDNVILPKK